MNLVTLLVLAVGLAMDAAAVSVARGLAVEKVHVKHVLIVALAFGGFQALMPALGWIIGAQFGAVVADWDHWVAFVLLVGIGGKSLWDSFREEHVATEKGDLFAFRTIFLLAIATSIDALAAGISLPVLGVPLFTAVLVIGLVTAILSALGVIVGRRFGAILGNRLDQVGGIVLIGIGGKILIEHLFA